MKSSTRLVVEVPPGVVTVTLTTPVVPGGLVAATVKTLTRWTFVAAVKPKATCVAEVKLVPVMVTLVPPELGPDPGLIPVTVGGPATV